MSDPFKNVTNTNQLQNQFQQNTGSQNVSTNTSGLQSRDPYGPAIPNINDILAQAGGIYGQTAQSPNPWLTTGLGQQAAAANSLWDSGSAQQPYYNALGASQTPITPDMQPWLNALGNAGAGFQAVG